MSEELADSIVLAARKMEWSEIPEVISVIRYVSGVNSAYSIHSPRGKMFSMFEDAYNYLVENGYQEVNTERSSHLMKLMKIGHEEDSYPVVMIMSKKVVNKE